MENAIGTHLTVAPSLWSRFMPEEIRNWSYRFSMERGFLDAILGEYFVRPFLALFRFCDRLERRWTGFLAGTTPARLLDRDILASQSLEESVDA
jgi:NAD(P)H-quinone oxidoreductase subunit 5